MRRAGGWMILCAPWVLAALAAGSAEAEERVYEIQWKAVGAYHPNGTPATEVYADEPAVFILEAHVTQVSGPPAPQKFRVGVRPFNPQGASEDVVATSGTPARVYVWIPPGTRSSNRYAGEVFPHAAPVDVPQGDTVRLEGRTSGYWIFGSEIPGSWSEDNLGPTGTGGYAREQGERRNIPEWQHDQRLFLDGDEESKHTRVELYQALDTRLQNMGQDAQAMATLQESSGVSGADLQRLQASLDALEPHQKLAFQILAGFTLAGGKRLDAETLGILIGHAKKSTFMKGEVSVARPSEATTTGPAGAGILQRLDDAAGSSSGSNR